MTSQTEFSKNILYYVKRGGKSFPVVDECETDVCVEAEFSYAQKPFNRILRLWWSKTDLDQN